MNQNDFFDNTVVLKMADGKALTMTMSMVDYDNIDASFTEADFSTMSESGATTMIAHDAHMLFLDEMRQGKTLQVEAKYAVQGDDTNVMFHLTEL